MRQGRQQRDPHSGRKFGEGRGVTCPVVFAPFSLMRALIPYFPPLIPPFSTGRFIIVNDYGRM